MSKAVLSNKVLQDRFVSEFEATGSMSKASKACGITPVTASTYKRRDPDFARRLIAVRMSRIHDVALSNFSKVDRLLSRKLDDAWAPVLDENGDEIKDANGEVVMMVVMPMPEIIAARKELRETIEPSKANFTTNIHVGQPGDDARVINQSPVTDDAETDRLLKIMQEAKEKDQGKGEA